MEVFKTSLHATYIPFAFLHFSMLSPTAMEGIWMAIYMLGNTCCSVEIIRFLLNVETLDYCFYSKKRQVLERMSNEQLTSVSVLQSVENYDNSESWQHLFLNKKFFVDLSDSQCFWIALSKSQ